MKKIIPFIFPAIALVIVLGLLYRWYVLRTNRTGQISQQADSIQVQDLSATDKQRLSQGAKDLKTMELEPPANASPSSLPSQATLRYEINQGKINFSLSADLPTLKNGVYQVWLKSNSTLSKAMKLEPGKGGWLGSGSISTDRLPVDVVISKEISDDNQMEQVILQTSIKAGQ